MSKMNAFYAQSGGVTAVINASACGVIETARKHKDKIGKVYAGSSGIIGALTEELIDTSKETKSTIAGLRSTPSGAFGSCRFKLKSLEENKREYERLIEVFKAHNIGFFFYNGGGDSADTCHKISQLSEKMGYPSEIAAVGAAIGHGVGLSNHEKPFISRAWSLDHPEPVEAGMHFALETFAGDGEDGARIESQLIVTENGHKIITRWPCEKLMVCAPR